MRDISQLGFSNDIANNNVRFDHGSRWNWAKICAEVEPKFKSATFRPSARHLAALYHGVSIANGEIS